LFPPKKGDKLAAQTPPPPGDQQKKDGSHSKGQREEKQMPSPIEREGGECFLLSEKGRKNAASSSAKERGRRNKGKKEKKGGGSVPSIGKGVSRRGTICHGDKRKGGETASKKGEPALPQQIKKGGGVYFFLPDRKFPSRQKKGKEVKQLGGGGGSATVPQRRKGLLLRSRMAMFRLAHAGKTKNSKTKGRKRREGSFLRQISWGGLSQTMGGTTPPVS